MKLSEFAKNILLGDKIEDKLLAVEITEFDSVDFSVPNEPSRSGKLEFSEKQMRFPKGHFHLKEKRAMALNSFANHELLAIEMMACALLVYPHHTDELVRFKRGIINSLKDEQKHFSLYANRMNDMGYEFGDFELNHFFWRQMEKMKTPSEYLSVMALTFEAANLDFAHFYDRVFREEGDLKTANILKVVYEDEISHVNLGVHYLNLWKKDKSLWDYYQSCLPFPLNPARSKGKVFVKEARQKAKMESDFIQNLENYQSDFQIVQRREWK